MIFPRRPIGSIAREGGKTVSILDLQSGNPQLAIDTDMGVRGLGVTRSAVVVVGEGEIGTWSLTVGEVGVKLIGDVVQSKTLDFSSTYFEYSDKASSRYPLISAALSPQGMMRGSHPRVWTSTTRPLGDALQVFEQIQAC